jgi:hypothetical protein
LPRREALGTWKAEVFEDVDGAPGELWWQATLKIVRWSLKRGAWRWPLNDRRS